MEEKGKKKKKNQEKETRTTARRVARSVWLHARVDKDRLFSFIKRKSTPPVKPGCCRLVRRSKRSCAVRVQHDVAPSVSLRPPCLVRSAWSSQAPGGCRVARAGSVRARGWPNPVECAWAGVADGAGGGVDREPASREDQPGG